MASYVSTFTGDGSEVHFTAGFPVLRLTDLAVVVDNVWLTLGTDYSVSGSTNSALATLAVAPTVGATVVLRSAVGYTPTDPAAVTTAAPTLNDTDTALWEAIGSTGSTGQAYTDAAVAAEAYGRAAADAAIIASGDEPADVGLAPVIATGTVQARTVNARAADEVWLEDFGEAGTGDWTAILMSALTFLCGASGTGPGGILRFSRRTYRIDGQITMPQGASTTPGSGPPGRSTTVRLVGQGHFYNDSYRTDTPANGTVLDLRYEGTGGRLFLNAGGLVSIEDLSLVDGGGASPGNSTPFIYNTSNVLRMQRVAIWGAPGMAWGTRPDAVVLGGTGYVDGVWYSGQDADPHSAYAGYTSGIRDCQFQWIGRALYGRVYAQAFFFEANQIAKGCGGPCAFELDGSRSTGAQEGSHGSFNVIGNYWELPGYEYIYKLKYTGGNLFMGNCYSDGGQPGGLELGVYYFDVGAEATTCIQDVAAGLGINNSSTLEVVAPAWDITAKRVRIQGESYIPTRIPTLVVESAARFEANTPSSQRIWGAKDTANGNEYWWEFDSAADTEWLYTSHNGGSPEPLIRIVRYAADAKRFTFGGTGVTQLRTEGELWVEAAGGSRANFGTMTSPGIVSAMDNALGFFGTTPVSKRSEPTGTDSQKITALIQILKDYGLCT